MRSNSYVVLLFTLAYLDTLDHEEDNEMEDENNDETNDEVGTQGHETPHETHEKAGDLGDSSVYNEEERATRRKRKSKFGRLCIVDFKKGMFNSIPGAKFTLSAVFSICHLEDEYFRHLCFYLFGTFWAILLGGVPCVQILWPSCRTDFYFFLFFFL